MEIEGIWRVRVIARTGSCITRGTKYARLANTVSEVLLRHDLVGDNWALYRRTCYSKSNQKEEGSPQA